MHSLRFLAPPILWDEELARRGFRRPTPYDFPAIIAWFRAQNPYYRRRLRRVHLWSQVPILTKEKIRLIKPEPFNAELFESSTSGTTGFRVSVINDAAEIFFRRVLEHRPFCFYDLPTEVRQLTLAEARGQSEWPREHFVMAGRTFRRWLISDRATPASQVEAISRIKPHLLTGYTSALVRLAEACGRRVRHRSLRLLSPGGEYMEPKWRALLQDTFGVPVYDRYGCTECGAIAWQCPFCNAYHGNADEMIIEPSKRGLVVTPLFLAAQPLLRYRIGDFVVWNSPRYSKCEIKLPTLTIMAARRDDWLYDGSDRKVSGLGFQFEACKNLVEWRIRQSSNGSVTIYTSWNGGLRHGDRSRILAEVREVVPGRRVDLVEGVHNCPRLGKFKRVCSQYHPT